MSVMLGMLAAIVSGLLNGSFAVPMKKTVKWEWENTWLMYAVTAMILYPIAILLLCVPDAAGIYRQAPPGVLFQTLLFGAGWGLGAVMFGLGLHLLGLSFGYTIMIGTIAVAGALIPMLVQDPGSLLTPGGLLIVLAMLATIFGVWRCGRAGKTRAGGSESAGAGKGRFQLGLVVCIVAGILSSMLNFAFHFGAPIAGIARGRLGIAASDFQVNHAVWFIALLGGFAPFLVYCGYLLLQKGSWRKYGAGGSAGHWFWAFLMGTLWMGCIALYGIGASSLGRLGTTVGWLVLMAVTVLTGNLWGVATGEWKGAPREAKAQMVQGVSLLVLSLLLVGIGKMLLT